jgi:hypothetical protein
MKKNNFEKFVSNKINATQLTNLKGGDCTGGGFVNFGGGNYYSWSSDTTTKSNTTYNGYQSVCNGKPCKYK